MLPNIRFRPHQLSQIGRQLVRATLPNMQSSPKSSMTARGLEDVVHRVVEFHSDFTPTDKIVAGFRRIEGTGRVPLVLVACGPYNPIHLNDIRMFQTACRALEQDTSYGVVGGLICPFHQKYVEHMCRNHITQAIPARHRTRMAEALTKDSTWIDVSRWEVTRNTGFLDYPGVLEHVSSFLISKFGPQLKVMYLCGVGG